MRILLSTAAVATGLSLASCASEPPESVKKYRAALDRANVSLSDSIGVAVQQTPESVAVRARLRIDADPVFSVGALQGGAMHDVRVDLDGNFVSTESLGASSRKDCSFAVSVAEAVAAAEAEIGGEAVAVETDDDEECVREVMVLDGDTLWEAEVDGEGNVVETEDATFEEEEEEDD
jgi:hypothetical protein